MYMVWTMNIEYTCTLSTVEYRKVESLPGGPISMYIPTHMYVKYIQP